MLAVAVDQRRHRGETDHVDAAARQRAIDLSGQELVPVIEVNGLVLGDFDTGQLEAFLRNHGYLE